MDSKFGVQMTEAEFTRRYVAQMVKRTATIPGQTETWMYQSAEAGWDIYQEDDTCTPEDMADEELTCF